ncbi:MAG: hypothetical protein JXA96_08335 [Sedimentisphaerales bacterium]|nr:hypothetical protein [Sedimentisphaerales bacterium]
MRLTEKQIIKELFNSKERYKPLILKDLYQDPLILNTDTRADAVAKICIENGPCLETVLEIVPVATPNNILNKSKLMKSLLNNSEQLLLIVAPYISGKAAKILENEGISWIDLCGNMRVSVPGKIYIEKSGNKNKFPDTSPIKKIFEGTSSLVSRALLLKPEGFKSQYELADFINSLNANITKGTVSRILKSLEDDILIRKDKSLIQVIDSEKLLDRLLEGYIKSSERKMRKIYKYTCENPQKTFRDFFQYNIEYLACGFYAAKIKGLAFTDEISIFVKTIDDIRNALRRNWIDIEPNSEFGNLTIIETQESGVWFNTIIKLENPIVDDIELYLEMMNDIPRGPKVADKLRELILKYG